MGKISWLNGLTGKHVASSHGSVIQVLLMANGHLPVSGLGSWRAPENWWYHVGSGYRRRRSRGSWIVEMLVQKETLASLITEDPFCAQEGVKTLESTVHHERLVQIEQDLRLHLKRQNLPCTLTSDLLIRNVSLKEGLAPDIAIWPGRHLLDPDVDYGSLTLSAELCPSLVLEVASESTATADRETKHEIYRLAEISEYWLYDPLGYAGGPPFVGWRLRSAEYEPIEGQIGTVAGQAVTLYPSVALNTAWGLECDADLRLLDPIRADWYRMTPEALEQAEARIQQERSRAEQAEARIQQERVRSQQQADLLQQEIQRLHALLGQRSDRA